MKINQKVRLRRLCDRPSQDLRKRVGKTGQIQEFKMVDGSSVGLVVKFDDGFATWFFEDELEPVPELELAS
ncbi:MAG: DUF2862 domain-containing protein [Leptolyngbyaceae cyanobacterium MO_188.B28]|nr:DUF2862 domain-containing protein [Leptolyngbyaceae cyanobacterium MO_188.B28]